MKSVHALSPLALPLLCSLSFNALSIEEEPLDAFLDLNLEDLLSMEITSVSKKKQRLSEAAAAIFVITNEDIRRSGVTSIADALRLAPGIQVAKMDSNKWAVSSRGFNAQFANKLLVLMDGRSVYTPSYSGVYWEDQDTILEDIERIEVIRGPGATLWGANAVNGVINIITKSASKTKGGLFVAGSGDEVDNFAHYRHGFNLAEGVDGRAYFKFKQLDSSYATDLEQQAGDEWQSLRAGFRIDGNTESDQSWTVQGDTYQNDLNQIIRSKWLDPFDSDNSLPFQLENLNDKFESNGHNLLARWENPLSEQSLTSLQFYYDHTERQEDILGQEITTFDIDFQHRYQGFEGHDLVWGLGYRHIEDKFDNTFGVGIDNPDHLTSELTSAFIQDEISLKQDALRLTLGSKFEHNDYTGTEIQPSARLLWKAKPGHTLWSSISRAVRTPSAVERRGNIVGFVIPGLGPVPTLVSTVEGSEDYDSEKMTAFELGYRITPSEKTSIDLSVFQNDYDNFLSFETTSFGAGLDFSNIPNTTLYPSKVEFDNKREVTARGLELVFDWYVEEDWRLQTTYSYIDITDTIDSDSNDDISAEVVPGSTPENHLSIRSAYDFSQKLSLDVWVYYVDELSASAYSVDSKINDYSSVNLRIGWRPDDNMEFSVTGHNLNEDRHAEFVGENFITRTEVERSIYAQFRLDF